MGSNEVSFTILGPSSVLMSIKQVLWLTANPKPRRHILSTVLLTIFLIARKFARSHVMLRLTRFFQAGCSAKNISTAKQPLLKRIMVKARSSYLVFARSTADRPGAHFSSFLAHWN